jgi:Heat shock protein
MKLPKLTILFIGLMLLSCDKNTSVGLSGKWRIVEYKCIATSAPIGLSQVPDNFDYSLEFDNQGNVICNTGCNLVSGQYTVKGDELTFPEITSTEMACEDMLVEESVKHILPVIKTFEIKNDTILFLKNADGHTLMELTKIKDQV